MEDPARLTDLSTVWDDLRAAHGADADQARAAKERLLQRYGTAVKRYLQAAVRDGHAAEDLFQEFAVRLLRGDFAGVCADRGRFRPFLKTVLHHLVVDWQRRQKRLAPSPEVLGLPDPPADPDPLPLAEADAAYLAACKQDLFDQAWEGLRLAEKQRGKPLYTVLRRRTDHPDLRSANLADRLTVDLGRPVSAGQVRKLLLEGRDVLADHLVRAAALSVDSPTVNVLADELEELGLLGYCREALDRWAAEKGDAALFRKRAASPFSAP